MEATAVAVLLLGRCFCQEIFDSENLTEIMGRDERKVTFQQDNQNLYEKLFRNYNEAIPPIYTKNSSSGSGEDEFPAMEITVTLTVAKLLEVSPPRQMMTMIFEFFTLWEDARLTWNPEDFGGIDHLYVRREKVWVPEVSPFDSAQVIDSRPDYKQYAAIDYTGYVNFYTSTTAAVSCKLDIINFPFDYQNCSVKILSYMFNPSEMILLNYIYEGLKPEDVGNAEWQCVNMSTYSDVLFASTLPTQLNQFTFYMRRNPSFYLALIIIPSIILTALCIAGLFATALKLDNHEKLAMGLTTITSMAVMMGIVSESIPKAENVPKLSTFVTNNLLIVGSGIVVTILIPRLGQFFRFVSRCCCKCSEKTCVFRHFWVVGGLLDGILFLVFEFFVVWNCGVLLADENTLSFLELIIPSM